MPMRCIPTRAYFRPGEPIQLRVTFEQPVRTAITATVYHLADPVATWHTAVNGTSAILEGAVPAQARRGYIVQIQAGDETTFTAFDVLDDWTQAPRYGYLFDFSADRALDDMRATLDHLLALHVNGLQFYDWQYRHDTLLPPQDAYIDPLGRALSLNTIRTLIAEAHQRGMAAMPYTAIYAASPAFAADHPDWQLFDADGKAIDFAGGFLKLMNPCGAWQDHFVQECQRVLEVLPFDGIHIDQYGEPTTGFDSAGNPVDLPAGFASTIDSVRHVTPPDKAVLFNLVHNWPVDVIADSPLDFWYSELWPPDTSLKRLWQTVRDNRRLNDRPAVLAVYIPPEWETTVIAAQTAILAAGGTHIAHGEGGRYLSDPYFPKAGKPSPALAHKLKQLADFAVAYEEALIFAQDVTDEWGKHITVTSIETVPPFPLPLPPQGGKGSNAARSGVGGIPPASLIIHASENVLYVNVLRLDGTWDVQLPPREAQDGLRLSPSISGIKRIWGASPEEPLAQALNCDTVGEVVLPPLHDWLLICLEFEDTPTCPT